MKGFTLLETLIVIAIVAVISAVLIFVLNPAESLRKTRDTQRLLDLRTFTNALAFLTATKSNFQGTDLCVGDPFKPRLYISFPKDKNGILISEGSCPTPSPPPGSPLSGFASNWHQALTKDLFKVSGKGWIPVDFTAMPGGSPISHIPVDPVNSIDVPKDEVGADCPDDDDLFYRFTCFQPRLTWEFDVRLESKEFTVINPKALKDGGTNDIRYEVGTALNLLP